MQTQLEPVGPEQGSKTQLDTFNQQPEARVRACFSSPKVPPPPPPPPHCTHWHSLQEPSVHVHDVVPNENQRQLRLICRSSRRAKQVKKKEDVYLLSQLAARSVRRPGCVHHASLYICVCIYVAVGDRWVQGTSRHSVPESSVLPWSCPPVSMVIFSLRFLCTAYTLKSSQWAKW